MLESLVSPVGTEVLPHLFVPRERPEEPWIPVLTNLCIAAALFAIVLVLFEVMRKRRDVRQRWVFWLVGLFFGWRGVMQVLSIWTIYHPQVQVELRFRVASAVIGIVTATVLIWILPVLHRIPTTSELEREIEVRRQLEEMAREREERLRSFVDSVQDYAMYQIDQKGIVRSWNAGAERIKGYSAEEIVGRPFSIFYTREDVANGKPEQALAEATDTGRFETQGWRIRKDGSRFWGNVILRAIHDTSGKVMGFSKVTRDLTEARELEARYQTLLEAVPDAIVIVEGGGQIGFVNAAAERVFDYSREELIGKSARVLTPPRVEEAQMGFLGKLLDGVGEQMPEPPAEIVGLRRGDKEFPVELSISPLETREGRMVLFVIRDLTDKRAIEARFQSLLEAAPDAMVIVDANGRIEMANLQTERIFGYPRHELTGQSVELLLPATLREKHVGHRAEFFRAPRPRAMGSGLDLMAVRQDGSEFPVEISLSPLESPRGTSVTAAIRDVSERKQAAQLLVEKMTELRHSNEQLEQFAHIASHDLQEPLRMVTSYVQLLAKRYRGKLDDDADEFISYAVDGTHRMKRLIEDLLLYSRAGKGNPEVREFSSEAVLQQALENLRVRIEENGAVITHDGLPMVKGSAESTAQIFQNLVGNAIKYRGERTPTIHLAAKTTAAEWIFSVKDNGIGIDPQYFEKIFLIFQRLHGHDEYEGTGIGLAICHRVLQQQGGRIWVESTPGEGSTFYFALPQR